MELTHVDETGRPRMVDVSAKEITERVAVASGFIAVSTDALELLQAGANRKGDVLSVAELAGVMGAKKTAELIPLCHPIAVEDMEVAATVSENPPGVEVRATARATAKTGVEMEALVAVSVALLTVYDMMKSAGHRMVIGEIKLLEKTGGVRGDWFADPREG
ncbi:MAG: cyclic pyranopterin monophosphate synthase MoaC [Gemmatimonadales bacterium]